MMQEKFQQNSRGILNLDFMNGTDIFPNIDPGPTKQNIFVTTDIIFGREKFAKNTLAGYNNIE